MPRQGASNPPAELKPWWVVGGAIPSIPAYDQSRVGYDLATRLAQEPDLLVEPESDVLRRLASVYKLGGGRYVFYTDIVAGSPPITLNGVEIVPHGIQ